jgi:hypothetical protein
MGRLLPVVIEWHGPPPMPDFKDKHTAKSSWLVPVCPGPIPMTAISAPLGIDLAH